MADEKRARKVKAKYAKTNFNRIPPIQPELPFNRNITGSSAITLYTSSVKTAMEEIFLQADPCMDFESGTWVRGWERYLRRALNRSVTKNSAHAANIDAIFTGFFDQVEQRLDEGASGFEAFSHLVHLITLQFGEDDRGDSFTRLNSFCVPNGTTFAKFLQEYRSEVANVAHFSSVVKPDVGWIVEITRNKINKQFPSMMSNCYPGRLANAQVPYTSLDSMWKAFSDFSGNHTQAINGDRGASSLSLAGLSLHDNSGRRSQGRSSYSPSKSHQGNAWSSGTSKNPIVMHIKPNIVQDVFTTSYNAWPLASDQHWETVHTVSASFTQHKLPTLCWSPLSSSADRAQAFAANKGKCLNCHGTNQDMRHCPQPFTNASGMLNNDFRALSDGENIWQMWQARMRSHRTIKPNSSKNFKQAYKKPRSFQPNTSQNAGHHVYSRGYQAAHNTQQNAAALTVYQPTNSATPQPYHRRG